MGSDSETPRKRTTNGRQGGHARSWTVQQKFWFLVCSALVCWGVILALILMI